MSKELIEKARELSAAATPGPWCCGYSTVLCAAKDATTTTDRGEGLIAETVSTSDRVFIAESRTLLPALADLAESEGRRADEAEARQRWRPIENAPKDGTPILGQCDRYGIRHLFWHHPGQWGQGIWRLVGGCHTDTYEPTLWLPTPEATEEQP